MQSDSIVQASAFLWVLIFIIKSFDAWSIMIFIGAIHHVFNTNWAPPSFWMSMLISFAVSGLVYAKRVKINEALKEMELIK